MLHTIFKTILLSTAIIYLLTCTRNGSISGTIDETGTGKPTAAVIGLVVYENDMPVVGANVNLYNSSSVKKIVTSLKKTTAYSTIRKTNTNINGFFRIDSVDTGRYYLEINDHDSLGALVETGVKPGDSVVEVNATLRRLGAIAGKIDAESINKTGKTYVYINELQRNVLVNSDGSFQAENIPYHNYTFKIMHDTVAVHSVVDSITVKVVEGGTSYIGCRPPAVLLLTDTLTGITPFNVRLFFKVEGSDSDNLVLLMNYGDGTFDTLHTLSGHINHNYTSTGTFTVKLTADNSSGWMAKDSLLITVLPKMPSEIGLLGPSDGTIVKERSVELTWSASMDIQFYHLQVSTDSLFKKIVLNDSAIIRTSFVVTDLDGNSTFYWRVRAINGSSCSSWSIPNKFTVAAEIPETPVLLTPANGEIDVPVNELFSWAAVNYTETYHFQVSAEPSFQHLDVEYLSLTKTSKMITDLQKGIAYYWRVQAVNTAGTGEWSGTRMFTTVAETPSVPLLQFPSDQAKGIHDTVTLSWYVAPRATIYQLEVATDSTFQQVIIVDSALTINKKNLSGLPGDTICYWHVRASNPGGRSGWSETRSFETKKVGTMTDLKQLSNWTVSTGVALNRDEKLIIGDDTAKGDKIESVKTFVQPFTFVWWGSYPATTLSYHTVNVFDSLGTTAFSFFTRYQNPGQLGYTINVNGSYENVIASGITAIDNKITGEFKNVFKDDSVSYFFNDTLLAKHAFPTDQEMRISFTCYEHPFVIDSIYVVQY